MASPSLSLLVPTNVSPGNRSKKGATVRCQHKTNGSSICPPVHLSPVTICCTIILVLIVNSFVAATQIDSSPPVSFPMIEPLSMQSDASSQPQVMKHVNRTVLVTGGA